MNILEFAIDMETEGKKFYLRHAEENKENSLYIIFKMLADDEKRHADILRAYQNQVKSELPDSYLSDHTDIFKGQIKNDIKQRPEQLDAYREALKKEQESINLYRSLLDKSDKIDDIDIFGYLIEQEELHFRLIDDLIYHLERPASWVESAEFGVREDY